MKRLAFLATVFTTVLVVVLPFVGGGGPGISATATAPVVDFGMVAATLERPQIAEAPAIVPHKNEAILTAIAIEHAASLNTDFEHLAQKPVPKPVPPVGAAGGIGGSSDRRAAHEAAGGSCPSNVGGSAGGAPGKTSAGGVAGTTSGDIASFASTYNAIRVANCLNPIPMGNFRYDSCMESRLFWMAESPSEDPMDAWGHMGSTRIDGVPSVGCDGNLAGGYGNTGATVANKWWASSGHRASLYRPSYSGGTGGVCILFAMTHGGIPNEPYAFTRAAARWTSC